MTRRTRIELGKVARALLVLILAYGAGFVWFAEDIARVGASDTAASDAIVVLTGGPQRVREGLELMRAGRARKLLVSGVSRGVEVGDLLRVSQFAGPAPCCIELGYAADSTLGNALETRAFMMRESFASLRLVTANYHMRRALLEFRRVMPAIAIAPHPVLPDNFRREAWWVWPGTLALIAGEYHKYLAALARPYLGGLFD
jgi:uncharacterized SAM-binding protein YcdF (DUF218 family)